MTPSELTQWREAHSLERPKLADMLGCSRKTVWAWELETRPIPRWLVRALRDIERELQSNQEIKSENVSEKTTEELERFLLQNSVSIEPSAPDLAARLESVRRELSETQ